MPKKLKIGTIIVILIIVFVSLNFFQKEVRNFFYSISSPFQKTLWRTGDSVSGFFGAIANINNLNKENEKLKLKVQELLAENSSLQDTKKENNSLREVLGLDLEKEFKLKMAEVIGKDIFQNALVIDKGEEDGITQGSPVITSQKILLGRISQVYKDFSKVSLVSDKNSSFDAKIANSDIYGIIKGRGGLNISFELLPKDKEVRVGDAVLTTPLSGIFPKDLLIGEIKSVKKTDADPFQSAEVQPAFSIQGLENLFIISSF